MSQDVCPKCGLKKVTIELDPAGLCWRTDCHSCLRRQLAAKDEEIKRLTEALEARDGKPDNSHCSECGRDNGEHDALCSWGAL